MFAVECRAVAERWLADRWIPQGPMSFRDSQQCSLLLRQMPKKILSGFLRFEYAPKKDSPANYVDYGIAWPLSLQFIRLMCLQACSKWIHAPPDDWCHNLATSCKRKWHCHSLRRDWIMQPIAFWYSLRPSLWPASRISIIFLALYSVSLLEYRF